METPDQDKNSDLDLEVALQQSNGSSSSSSQLWPKNGPKMDKDQNETESNNTNAYTGVSPLDTTNEAASIHVLHSNNNESVTTTTSSRIRRDVPVPYIQGAAAVGLALGLATAPTMLELAAAP
jgi:cytoskeletal protein RodZ